LIAATFALWSPSLKFGFVYDDHEQIESNKLIQSWSNVGQLISEPLWSQLGAERASHYYRPVFSLLLLLQHSLFGPNPFGWHLVSIALHVATTCAVFWLLLLHFKGVVAAFCGALLFAVSPLQTEVVSWISASDESLCVLFIVMSLFFLALSSRSSSSRARLLCRFFSAWMMTAALFSKETGVLAVALLLSYEAVVLERPVRVKGLAEYAFYVVPIAGYTIIRFAIFSSSPRRIPERSVESVIQTMPKEIILAVKQLAWPLTISPFYDMWLSRDHNAAVIAGLLAGLCITVVLFNRLLRGSRFVAWILLVLTSPIALIIVGLFYLRDYDLFHDRYLYLSAVGLSILVGFLVEKWATTSKKRGLLLTVTLLICALSAFRASAVSQPYRDDLALFRHAVEVAPQNIIAIDLLANAEMAVGLSNDAIDQYRQAERIRPDLWTTNFHLGIACLRTGHRDEAEKAFLKASQAGDAAEQQKALAWYEYGLIRERENDLASAEAAIRRAEELEPKSVNVHGALVQILVRQGRLNEARIENLKVAALRAVAESDLAAR
jgi:tetratricopeptide (TPR) repeat protein